MLVLAAQKEEEFILFDESNPEKIIAKVKICDIRGDKVRLGFQAEKQLRIDREVVYQSKMEDLEKLKSLIKKARKRVEGIRDGISVISIDVINSLMLLIH